jgi:Ca2+-binding RTX toxin-like protein
MRAGLQVLVVAAAAAVVLAASGTGEARRTAGAFIGPYTGVATGGVDRFGHKDNQSSDPKSHVVSTSNDSYRGRFTYSFRIDNGVIKGNGNGAYQSATWHLSGTNGDKGSFDCDIPITTQPFSVRVTGFAAGGELYIRFLINDDALERNADYDCGADFKGFATSSHYLQESFDLAQGGQPGGYLVIGQHHPHIGHLAYNDIGGPPENHHVRTGAWDVTIQAPSNTGPPSSGGPGPDGSKQRNSSTRMCTIQGTAHRDVLRGTSGDDVICGFGGNDSLSGLGGNDLIFGGPGNDTLVGGPGLDSLYGDAGNDVFRARDGERDTVIGGPGRDRATIDKGKDRTQSVERRG